MTSGTPQVGPDAAPNPAPNPAPVVGQRVRVIQQVPRLSGSHATSVEGEVIALSVGKTGSWFAHSKDKKLWLERIELRKDDGELVTLNLDQYSRVDVLGD